MQITRHTFSKVMFSAIMAVYVFSGNVYGRSIYSITTCDGINNSTITAYGTQGERIVYQIDTGIDKGSIGLAIDPDSETLFATYDNFFSENQIVLINAKTMQQIKSIPVSNELAGIVYDRSRQKIYTVGRQDNKLYVYLWNPITQTLMLENGTYKILENIAPFEYGAYGLAFDEDNDILYVTDRTNTVKYYDSNDPNFGYLGSVPITFNGVYPVAIGVDLYNDGQGTKCLYTGAWMHQTQNIYLVRTDISDINDPCSTYKDTEAGVLGIAVDKATGLIYITASGYWGQKIEVYNDSTFPTDPCYFDANDIGVPADIIVRGDVSYKPPFPMLTLVKEDNIDGCVETNDEIIYTIAYDANGDSGTSVVITDYLPYEVNYISSDGNYNDVLHTVTWNIGTLSPDESNSFTLTVQVKELSELQGIISNYCEIEGDQYCSFDTVITDVNSPIIYVDVNADGSNNGLSWYNADPSLQSALEKVELWNANQIWVAEGTYQPTKRTDIQEPYSATFQLLNGIAIYGGFPSGGGKRNRLEHETILDGDMDPFGVYYVVLAVDVNEATILNGFTVKKGMLGGIECRNSSTKARIINCNIADNSGYGIKCWYDAEPNIINCKIERNDDSGIRCQDASPTIINCEIANNGQISTGGGGGGIYCESDASPEITNCIFYGNSAASGGGICNSYSSPTITNCTFTKNYAFGPGMYNMGFGGGILNYYSSPTITNCIFWANWAEADPDANEIYNDLCNPDVNYCDVQGGWGGDDNIDVDPCFYEPDANNHHLKGISRCIDAGVNEWPGITLPDIDIDGQGRIIDGDVNDSNIVDIGADEYYWRPPDFSADGIVNFIDYAMFALAWRKGPNDTGYDDMYDLNDNNSIDYADLNVFCEDWLTETDWYELSKSIWMGMGGGMGRTMGEELVFTEVDYSSAVAEPSPSQRGEGEQKQPEELTELEIEMILKWLDELWLNPEIRKAIDEDAWLKFIESIKQVLLDY